MVSFIYNSPVKTCDPPVTIFDGMVKIQGREVGDAANFSCREGFWYKGENPRICQKDNTWTGEDGSCEGKRGNFICILN